MSGARDDELYVGYLPQAPAGLGRWLRPRVVALLLGGLALAALLAAAQAPFARARFEYGTLTTVEGTLFEGPVPHLQVVAPGGMSSDYLLVGAGKFGAAEAVRGHDGNEVKVTGTLIYRDGQTMIELAPGSVRDLVEGTHSTGGITGGSELTLRGEIVDSKCFLGVMKPGHLKTHRACAVRCISGGVPPVLLVRGADGSATYFLLVGPGGRPVNQEVLPYVAEPVEITGQLSGYHGPPVLEVDPADIRRLP